MNTISVQITEVINNKFQHQCHSYCSYTDYTVENLEMLTLTTIRNDKATLIPTIQWELSKALYRIKTQISRKKTHFKKVINWFAF